MGSVSKAKKRRGSNRHQLNAAKNKLNRSPVRFAGRTRPLSLELLEDRRLLAIQPFPVPLQAIDPNGSLLYETSSSAAIDAVSEVESFTIDLDDGQSLSIVVDPAATLRPVISLRDPSNVVLGTVASNGAGLDVLMQAIATTGAGTYTIDVTEIFGTTGSFAIDLLVNGAIEAEGHNAPTNNTSATAQSIGGFIELGAGGASHAAVVGALPAPIVVLDSENFESGVLDGQWSTSTSLPGGRIRVIGEQGTAAGSFALLMDRSQSGSLTRNEAIWTVDLTGIADATLSFSHSEFNDEETFLPQSYSGSADGDGVSISADGLNWRTILNATAVPFASWAPVTIDLDAAAAAAGMTLGPNFKIKFQQYDDFPLQSDGRGYDEIRITGPAVPDPADWYRFELSDGESTSIALDNLGAAAANLELYASNGTTLLTSGAVAINSSHVINNFVNVPGGDAVSTYFVRVSGTNAEYSLVVTRGAGFDTEPSNDFDNAQDISEVGGALGHISGPSTLGPASSAWLSPDVPRGGAAQFGIDVPNQHADFQPSITLPYNSDLSFEQAMVLLAAQAAGGSAEEPGATPEVGGADLTGPIPILQSFAGPGASGFIPPDPTAAAGPEHVVAMVNTDIVIYDKATGAALFAQDMNGPTGFFGSVGANTVVFDPWVFFDPDSQRFFALGIDVASSFQSNVFLAVSTDATPTSGADWHKYKIDFTHDPTGTGLGSGAHFPDYPKVGVNSDAIFVSGNYFPIASGSGVYAGITAIEKAPLLSGGPANIVFEEFFNGFSVFPVVQYDSGSVQYFAESFFGGGNTITVHAISNVLTSPTHTATNVAVPSYQFPDDIPQLGGGVPADSVDARIMGGVLRDGSLWITHGAEDPFIGDGEAVARWYEIDVTGAPTLVQAGNVDPGPGVHAWMPNIAVDGRGNMGIGFALGGPTMRFGAGFTGRLASDTPGTTALPVTTYATGQGFYQATDNAGRNRWGDYSGLSIDPADDATFWVFNEYASTSNNWATQIASFQLEEPFDDDWYRFNVSLGDVLTVTATLPGGGPLQFVNELASGSFLRIELYDPSGDLVALDDDLIVHTATSAGDYRLRVYTLDLAGEYFVEVSGATAANRGPTIIDADPDNGVVVAAFPTTYTLDFSESLLLTSIQAGDLRINGIPALNALILSGSTVQFTINPFADIGDGTYSVQLAAGAVTDLQGKGNDVFNGTFRVDRTGPIITNTLWNGSIFTGVYETGALTFEATFNEDLFNFSSPRRGPLSPSADDVVVYNSSTGQFFTATSAGYSPTTDKFTAAFSGLTEGIYTLILISGAGAFEDLAGNALDGEPFGAGPGGTPTGNGVAGGDYVANFVVDRITPPTATAFERLKPLGGLIYRGTGNTGLLHNSADVDDIRVHAESGETVAAILTPFNPAATMSIQLVGAGPAIVASGPGQPVMLPATLIGSTGLQSLRVAGDAAGSFSLDILLNASNEALVGDSGNGNELAIDSSLVTLGSGRFGVIGYSDAHSVPVGPGRLFAVPADGSHDIVELNPSDGSEVNRFDAPEDVFSGDSVSLTYDGDTLFFLNSDNSGMMYELNPDTGAVLDADYVPGRDIAAVAGKIYYISSLFSGFINEFDPVSDTTTAAINFGGLNGVGLGAGMAGITGPSGIMVQTDVGTIVEVNRLTGLIVGPGFTPDGSSVASIAVVGGQIYLGDLGDEPEINVYGRNGALVRGMDLPYGVHALGGDDLLAPVAGGDLLAERNDTIGMSTNSGIGGAVTRYSGFGRIGDNPNVSPGLDVDIVRMSLTAGDYLVVDIDASLIGTGLDPILTLFNSAGTIIAQNDDFNSLDSFLNVSISTTGTYYVGVSGYSNFNYNPNVEGSGTFGSIGNYKLGINVTGNVLTEPNDTVYVAENSGLAFGFTSFTQSGSIGDNLNISANLDVDLIKVELGAGDRVIIDIDANQIGTSLDPILTLFDSAGGIVAQNDDFNGLDSYLDVTVLASDTYYVGVSGFSNFNYDPFVEGSGTPGSTGAYTLSINATFNSLVNPDAFILDVDEYTLDLTALAGESLDILVAGLTNSLSGESLQILDTDGSTVLATGSSTPLGQAASNFDVGILDFVVPAGGVYTVRLSSRVAGDYGLIVTHGLVFENELNDSDTDALRSLTPGDTALGFLDGGFGSSNPAGANSQTANTPGGKTPVRGPDDGQFVLWNSSVPASAATAWLPVGVSYADLIAQLQANPAPSSKQSATGDPGVGSSINTSETESNDTLATANFMPLGFDPGEDVAVNVSGTITSSGTQSTIFSSEDDGSIPLANATALTTGNSVFVTATIGDGPFGGSSGDYDFYAINGVASGQLITVDIDAQVLGSTLDSWVGIYDSAGVLLTENDQADFNDSYLAYTTTAAGDYYVVVLGWPAFFQIDPFDSGSGTGVGTTGFYELTIGLNALDVDYFRVTLSAGDILGASLSGAGNFVSLQDSSGNLLMGSPQDATFIHPVASPLPGGGNAALSWVVDTPGDYYIGVQGAIGSYDLDLRVFRPALESQVFGTHQILYLDFDGASLDRSIFGGVGTAVLSPLSTFLPGWGLTPADESAVIDAIIASVQESISTDLRTLGNNGDFDVSGINGQFDIEIRNSRDHADPFGLPNVSRVVVGGTIAELGLSTIGIAETIDVGNFDTSESAVVLLDLLSAPGSDPNSLNQYPRDPSASIIDLIGVGVGNITAHEAGHFFANWHTYQFNALPSIMDQGGNLANTIGLVGGVWGDGDENDVDFGPDTFATNEGFSGTENTLQSIAFGLSTGKLDPALVGPAVLSIDPPAGEVSDLNVADISIVFNEPISSASANDPANYRLIEAGLNNVFEAGAGDDVLVPFTVAFDGTSIVDLILSGGPLELGNYQLTIDGNSSIVDLDGNPLNSLTGPGGGSDTVHEFDIVFHLPVGGDLYELNLAAGQAVTISTVTPLSAPAGAPLNSLDPELRIYGPNGLPLISDLNSGMDGRNASLTLTAPTAGAYLIHVLATQGIGEYLLNVQGTTAPMLVGDYNDDDSVSAADYVAWRKFTGTTFPLPNDVTSSNVSSGDYAAWTANFGAGLVGSGNSISSPAVPVDAGAAFAAASPSSSNWSSPVDDAASSPRSASDESFFAIVELSHSDTRAPSTGAADARSDTSAAAYFDLPRSLAHGKRDPARPFSPVTKLDWNDLLLLSRSRAQADDIGGDSATDRDCGFDFYDEDELASDRAAELSTIGAHVDDAFDAFGAA